MFQSFFTGLSGMLSFSQNLDNVSNNIANMNTPGFKASDTFYRSLTSGDSALGTQISGQEQRFSNGDIRQTGSASDLAISGNGFFVLLVDGQPQFTRAGQFTFNEDGLLVDSVTGAQVAALDESGQLVPVDISSARVLAPQATSTVNFSGNLSTDMTTVEVNGITVFNGLGEQVSLDLTFTNNSATTAGSWLVEVRDADGNVIQNGEVRFDSDGTPADGFTSFTVPINDSQGGSDVITLDFGTNGSFAGATSVSGGTSSTLQDSVEDGFAIASLSNVTFSNNGQLQLNYSNGETIDGAFLAIANFTDLSVLELVEGSTFKATVQSGQTITRVGEDGAGTILAGSIELSNVDLSREFADMIIIQRGYQASSRILNIANQLLDQLYENTRS